MPLWLPDNHALTTVITSFLARVMGTVPASAEPEELQRFVMYFDGIAPSCNRDPFAGPCQDAAVLKAVVRGERAVEDLKATRIWLNARQGASANHAVCGADLAEGIVNLKDDPVALEELANAIVAVSGVLALEDEHSDRLISHVWDLALGAPLAESTIRLANAVRSRTAEPA